MHLWTDWLFQPFFNSSLRGWEMLPFSSVLTFLGQLYSACRHYILRIPSIMRKKSSRRLEKGPPWPLSFPDGSVGKESVCNAGDAGDMSSIPGLGRSPGEGEGKGNPLQYSCLEKSCGQRSLAGYSPWRHKESYTTKEARLTGLLGGQ